MECFSSTQRGALIFTCINMDVMKRTDQLFTLFLALLFAASCSPSPQTSEDVGDDDSFDVQEGEEVERPTPLLLIGMDGFKSSYLNENYGATPNFDRFIEKGVFAESLKPVFPTKTFVNLYSLATGLYPENTGIVGNVVQDFERDKRLHMHDINAQRDPEWWGGEPIWVTAELQGLRTATFFWVGSEAPIKDTQPTYWKTYDSRVPHSDRVDQVVEWFSQEDPVDFATLYFSRPDATGHAHGPNSAQMVNTVRNMDNQLGDLIDGLEEAGIWPDINIIIVSDHGMVELDEDKLILLEEIINLNSVDVIEWSPVAMIQPSSGSENSVYTALKNNEDNYRVYWKEDLPERFRIKESDRVPDIIVVADMPYTITTQSFVNNPERGVLAGGHGYDPEYEEMHGFFLANGPDFRDDHISEVLELVDVYGLMAHLLGLDPAQNDGDLDRIGSAVLLNP